jgi:hypothetical protein
MDLPNRLAKKIDSPYSNIPHHQAGPTHQLSNQRSQEFILVLPTFFFSFLKEFRLPFWCGPLFSLMAPCSVII